MTAFILVALSVVVWLGACAFSFASGGTHKEGKRQETGAGVLVVLCMMAVAVTLQILAITV